ncbi:hypothetical protein [Rubellimicrobium aerolatum]|uniref:YIP1 family protein n=1 Tax=Rubellimicrobium aerolatum TaxID=490979 RepID=A0ABW0S8F5_9RHOB|nr:hypothetical protein [Rubellimicrobium aerolatum]MBP1804236.1 hypothetical protein [Rubellimicrobium aerolatum]
MGVAADIRRSLTGGPRPVVREHLARGESEAHALALLMLGCGLVFVGQWPRLMRVAQEEGDDFARLVAYAMLGWMMIWPLVLYGLAALTHGVSRLLGGRGTPFGARLALFWSWLAAAPLGMLTGLLAGLSGSAALANLCGALWIAVFAAFWWSSQREAARGPRAHGV